MHETLLSVEHINYYNVGMKFEKKTNQSPAHWQVRVLLVTKKSYFTKPTKYIFEN
jgi:hypothetical protein